MIMSVRLHGEKVHRNSIHRSLYNIVSKEVLGSCGSFLQIESLSWIWGYSQMQEIQVQGGMWPSWTCEQFSGWVSSVLRRYAHPEFWTRPLGVLSWSLGPGLSSPRGQVGKWRLQADLCRQWVLEWDWHWQCLSVWCLPIGEVCRHWSNSWWGWLTHHIGRCHSSHLDMCLLISSVPTWLFHANVFSVNQHFCTLCWGATKRLC